MDFALITSLARLAQKMGVRTVRAFPAVPTASGKLRLWLVFGDRNWPFNYRYLFCLREKQV